MPGTKVGWRISSDLRGIPLDCIAISNTLVDEEERVMAKSRPPKQQKPAASVSPLMVRLDEESKNFLSRAAALRRISVSDYVRLVTVAQARKEVLAAAEHTISMTPEEQLAFWTALNETPKLTPAQKRLGALMRGEP
jgi:uncharacterized protein (DUF1778 family)